MNGTKTYYQYSGDKLIYQETGNKRLYFWYDAFGSLCEVLYDDNGTASAYMVVCNSRGDVERLYDVTGNLAARYVYDSWGNVISVVDQYSKPITNQNAIGNVNPIRYRGYYLDSETGYYYLQSRYYNPQIGRFLNADLYCDTETGALGTNMFAYCENNPVCMYDPDGYLAAEAATGASVIIVAILEALGIVIEGLTIASIALVGYLLYAILSSVSGSFVGELEFSDTTAEVRNSKKAEYRFCYMNKNGKKINVGKKMTWTQTMIALGVFNTTFDFNVTRDVNSDGFNNDAKTALGANGNCWGIYASSQTAAKTLAVALGSNAAPRGVQGGYAHYHDGKHKIHIWYGYKIK